MFNTHYFKMLCIVHLFHVFSRHFFTQVTSIEKVPRSAAKTQSRAGLSHAVRSLHVNIVLLVLCVFIIGEIVSAVFLDSGNVLLDLFYEDLAYLLLKAQYI